MSIQRGDVVIIDWPFSGGGGGKARPALVIQNDRDNARMHDLAVRNQNDELTPAEKKEMHDYGKAATVLSIFKSKARRTLGVKLKTRTVS